MIILIFWLIKPGMLYKKHEFIICTQFIICTNADYTCWIGLKNPDGIQLKPTVQNTLGKLKNCPMLPDSWSSAWCVRGFRLSSSKWNMSDKTSIGHTVGLAFYKKQTIQTIQMQSYMHIQKCIIMQSLCLSPQGKNSQTFILSISCSFKECLYSVLTIVNKTSSLEFYECM